MQILKLSVLCLILVFVRDLKAEWIETPSLQNYVKLGELPPIEQRLPINPRVVTLATEEKQPGVHGGTLRMLVGKQKDIRLIPYYSYSRLIGYNRDLQLVADILESYEVDQGKIFTFKLRKGHKWSDGHLLTSEDFRYVWEDIFNHPILSRGGLNNALLVDGQGPEFEVLDKQTVRYSWQKPNPNFLAALAAPNPLYLALPSHYLKQFHADYQDQKVLEEAVSSERVKDWKSLHIRKARMNKASNPDLPVLDAWKNTIAPPSKLFVFKRNPFFHRVDERGRQLPYIDKIQVTTVSKDLIPAKVSAGDVDLQARNLSFSDYTHLKEGEERGNYKVLLWRAGNGSSLALYPNLNCKDGGWRDVVQDVRFRRALSVAISRREINQIFYFGLASESANTVLPESPLYESKYQNAWTDYDPDLANNLLDDMNLVRKRKHGFRYMHDGRRLQVIVETAGENTQESDILELIRDHWRAIGVDLVIKNTQRDVLRRRAIAGETIMSVWRGLDNALVSAEMNPHELLPTSSSQLQWPQWGIYAESAGRKGEKSNLHSCAAMIDHSREWENAHTLAEKNAIWKRILEINSDQVFSIGTVNSVPQPVVVSSRMRNVPQEAVYAYAPMSFFGVYMPDTFWFEKEPEE